MRNALLLVAALSLLASSRAAERPTLTPEDVVGVWTICYEPGLEGVSELDASYYVFLPDRTYVQTFQPLDTPVLTESGRWEVIGSSVVLSPDRVSDPRGKTEPGLKLSESRLNYLDRAPVVLGPADQPQERAVLSRGFEIDYAYAKIL